MAYRAEIEIGVKGLRELNNFQANIERLSNAVDRVNKKQFVVANISRYNEQLRLASETLKDTQIELTAAGRATGLYKQNIDAYVTALVNSNAAQEIQNNLVAEEIQRRGAATEALKAYNAELAAPTRRGAMTTTAGAYLRGQPKFGPEPAPGFDPAAGAARARAAQLAAESIARGKKAKADIDLVRDVVEEQNKIQRRAFLDITQFKIELTQRQLDAEINNIEEVLSRQIAAGEKWWATEKKRMDARAERQKQIDDALIKNREEREKRLATIRREAERSIINLQKRADQDREQRSRRRKEAIGSGIIGGAFPLLFGQGAGASVGGGLGGFAGGLLGGQFGFGLSLVGTQIGVIFDQIIASATQLGQALNPVTADIGALADAAGFAGTETELYIKAIEQNAGKQAALKAATQQLALVVGQDGVKALQEFGEASRDLGNSWNQLMAQMSAGIAELLKGPTQQFADTLSDDAAFRGGLRQTEGPIGKLAKEYNETFAAFGKGGFDKQVKDRERLNQLYREIVRLVRAENAELKKNFQLTRDKLNDLKNIGNQLSLAQTQNSLLDIVDQANKRSEEAAKLRNQELKITQRQEERIESLRIGLEQQVASIRQQNLAREAQLRNRQEALEISRLSNRLRQASSEFSNSLRLDAPGREFAISINKAADEFTVALAVADAERNKNNRDSQLQLEQLSLQATQTRANIQRQVAKIQLDTERQITELNTKAAEYDARLNQDRFEIEKRITALQLDKIEAEAGLLRLRMEAEKTLNEDSKKYFSTIENLLSTAREAISDQKAPTPIGEFVGPEAAGVSTIAFDNLMKAAKELITRIRQVNEEITDQDLLNDAINFTNQISEQTNQLTQQQSPLERRVKILADTQEKARLVAEGFSDVDASAIIQGQKAFSDLNAALLLSRESITGVIERFSGLEKTVPAVAILIDSLRTSLEDVDKRLEDVGKQSNAFIFSFQKKDYIKDRVAQLKGEIKELTDLGNQVVFVADTIGSAFSTAFQEIATGAKSTQEALADAFEGIGKAFISMAAEIIAKQLVMITLQTILKALGAVGGVTEGSGTSMTTITNKYGDFGASGAANAAASLPELATGGPVTNNMPYIVGEEGPELFVPGANGTILPNDETRRVLAQQNINREENLEDSSASENTDDETRRTLTQQNNNREENIKDSSAPSNTDETKRVSVTEDSTTETRQTLIQQNVNREENLESSSVSTRSESEDITSSSERELNRIREVQRIAEQLTGDSSTSSERELTRIREVQRIAEQLGGDNTTSSERELTRIREVQRTREQLNRQQQIMQVREDREIEKELSSPRIRVNFDSQVINNVEYVTADQHRRGMAQAAEQGRALTLQALQNSVRSRRKVGLA